MKKSFILPTFAVAMMSAMICLSSPLFGYGDDETAMLNKAYDLVHQAWNPGDDPPSDTERTDLLNQALKLAQDAPQHNVKGHRVKAILEIKAALALIKAGDADHQAVEHIHQAADELRTALSIAE